MGATSAYGVLVYWPNLIGYLRIFCMLGSFYYHCYHEDWVMFLALYLAAFCGDVVDGYVARLFHQQSVFGGVLDMVTDRVSTCGLLTILASIPAYKSMRFPFVLLIALDIFSHWFHVSSVQGHHKSSEVLAHRNPLLRWYYSVYPLFGFCCVGTELFYVFLYFQSFKDKNAAFKMSSEAFDAALYLGFTGATFLALTIPPHLPLPFPSPYPPPLFFFLRSLHAQASRQRRATLLRRRCDGGAGRLSCRRPAVERSTKTCGTTCLQPRTQGRRGGQVSESFLFLQ